MSKPSIVFAVGLLAATVVGAAVAAHVQSGRLAGKTEIWIGCGAVRPGSGCTPWRRFPGARFDVAKNAVSGKPSPNARLVTATAQALFSLALPAGSYVIVPLAQSGTTGGPKLGVRIRPGQTTYVVVRFRT